MASVGRLSGQQSGALHGTEQALHTSHRPVPQSTCMVKKSKKPPSPPKNTLLNINLPTH